MPSLEDRIKGLPPDLRREVEDFCRFLDRSTCSPS